VTRLPTRETILGNRLLRPFAAHLRQPDLWHLNHVSVPRAAALGLGIGILVPFMHIVLVALLAIPARANILLAAGLTLLVNPLTMPPLYYSAYRLGLWELGQPPLPRARVAEAGSGELGHTLVSLHQVSVPVLAGIVTLALAGALLGYAGGAVGWRLWTRRRPTVI
jgi:uncharacterized protein (DUF2062 family)